MGCLKSKEKEEDAPPPMKDPEPPKKVDPRLPFETYRQLFNMKNSWKVITRSLESVAKDNLIRLFRKHPHYQDMHKNLKGKTEEDLAESISFETSASEVFNSLDEAMELIEKVDMAIIQLQNAGQNYTKLDNFDPQYFKDMEDTFIASCRECMGDRFHDATENNFRLFYVFACEQWITGYNAASGKSGATDTNRV